MKSYKLVCLGDSITWGFPFGPEYSWVEISAQALGFPIINRGINGETAEDLLYRFGLDVLAHKPSHVFIMAGINDACMNISLESFQDKIFRMHTKAGSQGIIPILALPTPTGDDYLEYILKKYRQWLTEFALTSNTALVDFAPAMLLPDYTLNPDCFIDAVHPSKAGYRSMAVKFIEFWRNSF